MSKKAFNIAVIDLAKYDKYFLTKHFHSAQSSEAAHVEAMRMNKNNGTSRSMVLAFAFVFAFAFVCSFRINKRTAACHVLFLHRAASHVRNG